MDDFIRIMMDATRDGMSRNEVISRCVSALYNSGYRIVQAESRDHARAVRPTVGAAAERNAPGASAQAHVLDRWLAQQDQQDDAGRREAPVAPAPSAQPKVPPRPTSLPRASSAPAPRRGATAMRADPRPTQPRRRLLPPRRILVYAIATTVAGLLAYAVISTPPRVSQIAGGERAAPMINWGGGMR